MTILQLKYVITVDEECSMRKAATKLYVSQPGLSSAIRELEKEIGFQIFQRVHNGVVATAAGAAFIAYARSAVEQYEKIETKYIHSKNHKPTFCVSMQHYSFAVNAFIEVVKEFDMDSYQFSIRETQTNEVINDLKTLKSEVGVIAVSDFNRQMLKRLFADYSLEFHPLFYCNTYVYLWKEHPLADREELSLEELQDYPCMVFDQGDNNSFYFREEALPTYDYRKTINTNERATSMELLIGLNGYAVGVGLLEDGLGRVDYKTIKLREEDILTLGYLVRKGMPLSEFGERFVSKLEKFKKI